MRWPWSASPRPPEPQPGPPARPSPLLAELKARLDRLVEEPDHEDAEFTPEHLAGFDEAARAFRAAGPELLDQATEHLWDYYLTTVEEFTPEELARYGIPDLPPTADIWAEVSIHDGPRMVPGGEPTEPARTYISFEGEVSWEREHGLQLVVEDGVRICKVGMYDGHVTNAAAFGDVSLLGEVYR